jgi:hypothetical protein
MNEAGLDNNDKEQEEEEQQREFSSVFVFKIKLKVSNGPQDPRLNNIDTITNFLESKGFKSKSGEEVT